MVSSYRDEQGRTVIHFGDPIPSRTATPARKAGRLPAKRSPIIIDPGSGGAQALIVHFMAGRALSLARLAIKPSARLGEGKALALREQIVARMAKSLAGGGSGTKPVELEWTPKDMLSLDDIATRISGEIGMPVTVDVPNVVTVEGKS